MVALASLLFSTGTVSLSYWSNWESNSILIRFLSRLDSVFVFLCFNDFFEKFFCIIISCYLLRLLRFIVTSITTCLNMLIRIKLRYLSYVLLDAWPKDSLEAPSVNSIPPVIFWVSSYCPIFSILWNHRKFSTTSALWSTLAQAPTWS